MCQCVDALMYVIANPALRDEAIPFSYVSSR
jgi:hypothetical protein